MVDRRLPYLDTVEGIFLSCSLFNQLWRENLPCSEEGMGFLSIRYHLSPIARYSMLFAVLFFRSPVTVANFLCERSIIGLLINKIRSIQDIDDMKKLVCPIQHQRGFIIVKPSFYCYSPYSMSTTRHIQTSLVVNVNGEVSEQEQQKKKNMYSHVQASSPTTTTTTENTTDYTQWSPSRLISRITELETQLQEIQATNKSPRSSHQAKKARPKKVQRPFDPSKYSTRYIALKLAYLGQRYNGFEWHANCPTPLPTVEEVLWRALRRARLILPSSSSSVDGEKKEEEIISWEGCEYSKCGRTDKGVSAFGQVVGIRVRSNRPLVVRGSGRGKGKKEGTDERLDGGSSMEETPLGTLDSMCLEEGDDNEEEDHSSSSFDPIRDEIPYPYILNRILPEDIRILAWCPSPPPDFSARFSCKERQYRYFFTQPAFPPLLSGITHVDIDNDSPTTLSRWPSPSPGWLDLDAMRNAARSFIGLHDFRNFCKVDPSKQITNFERRIYHADIIELDSDRTEDGLPIRSVSNPPRICAFVVHGSAFLWHQVRQMVAILFLIGQGLESPTLVSELLDVQRYPRRPLYEMADDAPLVLWDCIFPRPDDPERKDALEWIYPGDYGGIAKLSSFVGPDKYSRDGLIEDLWSVWRRRKMDEILMGSLLDVVSEQGQRLLVGGQRLPCMIDSKKQIFDGGNNAKATGTYIPVLQRRTLETVEEINRRFLRGKNPDVKGEND